MTMDFADNIHGFLANLPKSKRAGDVVFLATAAHLVGGIARKEIPLASVKKGWLKSIVGIGYNSIYYNRAKQRTWVNPIKKRGHNASLEVTEDGLRHLRDIYESEDVLGSPETDKLFVFDKKQAHTFDKLLRGVFADAKSGIMVADSYVDGNLVDRILDSAPKDVEFKLLYGHANSPKKTFEDRVKRFQKEWKKFQYKKYSGLHDRFVIVDDVGFFLGPSIKDATDNSPALVLRLSRKQSAVLVKFFNRLWTKR